MNRIQPSADYVTEGSFADMIKTDLMKKKPIGLCKVDPQNITVIYGLRVDESGENG